MKCTTLLTIAVCLGLSAADNAVAETTLTVLHSFNLSDGRTPWGDLVEGGDGNFYDELNVERQPAFVDEFAAEPLVEDVLDPVALPAILDAETDRVGGLEEAIEGIAVPSVGEAPARSCSDRDERDKERALAASVLPQEHRVFDAVTQAHLGALRASTPIRAGLAR